MRNRLFIPDFLFDFYTNRGSIGTPSALSNVSRAGLRKFSAQPKNVQFLRLFPYLVTRTRKSGESRETIFGSLVVGCAVYCIDIRRNHYSTRCISPTGSAANVSFRRRRGNTYKRSSLSIPSSRLKHHSAIKIYSLPEVYRF